MNLLNLAAKNGWLSNLVLIGLLAFFGYIAFSLNDANQKYKTRAQQLDTSVQQQSQAINAFVADLKKVPCGDLVPLFSKYGIK